MMEVRSGSGARYGSGHAAAREAPMLYCAASRQRAKGKSIMAIIEIKSEITGTVWQLKSKPGDKVESGDILIVIESMKMEIPVITEDGGTVLEIRVKEKDPVAEGQVVAIIDG
jgi:acetyl-CoA carboxylase biotin carboxyl carrier protein